MNIHSSVMWLCGLFDTRHHSWTKALVETLTAQHLYLSGAMKPSCAFLVLLAQDPTTLDDALNEIHALKAKLENANSAMTVCSVVATRWYASVLRMRSVTEWIPSPSMSISVSNAQEKLIPFCLPWQRCSRVVSCNRITQSYPSSGVVQPWSIGLENVDLRNTAHSTYSNASIVAL